MVVMESMGYDLFRMGKECSKIAERLSDKSQVPIAYIFETSNLCQIQNMMEESHENKVGILIVHPIQSMAYVLGGLVSRCGTGASMHWCTEQEEIVKVHSRCNYHIISRDFNRLRKDDIIICVDRVKMDLDFRIVDPAGKELKDFCSHIPVSDTCGLVRENPDVRESSLEEVLQHLEGIFTMRNERFSEIKEAVQEEIVPLLAKGANLILQMHKLHDSRTTEGRGFYYS